MNLLDALNPIPEKAVVSIVGGGGKTTTLFTLGNLLKGRSVLITTTTKILCPPESPEYRIAKNESELEILPDDLPVVYGIKQPEYPGKLTGCTFPFLEKMENRFNYILVEADGSAGRPVKAPEQHEPAVYVNTEILIGLIGLDCLGKPGDDTTVHRPARFAAIREKDENAPITDKDLIKLINHKEGLFKNAPERSRKIVLLNKADLISSSRGKELAAMIKKNMVFPGNVLLNSYHKNGIIAFL